MDKSLRDLERLQNQDPIKLKLLQRRLGKSVYIQETPRPIKVFNVTRLLIDISEVNRDRSGFGWGEGWGSVTGYGEGSGDVDGVGVGSGSGYGEGWGSVTGEGDGSGYGEGYGFRYGSGSGFGFGEGAGSQSGESEDSYTRRLKEKYDR